MIRWCTVPEIWCATDGQADRWWYIQVTYAKWHIQVGASPNKKYQFNNILTKNAVIIKYQICSFEI